ncbi:MAG: hypothetical protein H6865_03040 [Rhodospirillales bacterium]|nr:hypothetical protein [Alphaproteobacteria bacterium]MCB9986593.1 hypothetical protein [Rhodospirillales bacterium]USO06877.1 MAG: hypothetical protein H6866_05345 [Rhodospirillales bacterium]
MSGIDQLPPVPPPGQPRRTENTDTRQDILHHDPEFYKQKKKRDEEAETRDPYEDLAEVSVPALRNFLMSLADRPPPPEPPPAAPVHEPPHTPTPQQAAASAYQKRAGVTPASSPPPVTTPAPTALDAAAAALDRAEILDLIRDLDRLAAAGIETIALEKGDGFLASIRAGITRARASLSQRT